MLVVPNVPGPSSPMASRNVGQPYQSYPMGQPYGHQSYPGWEGGPPAQDPQSQQGQPQPNFGVAFPPNFGPQHHMGSTAPNMNPYAMQQAGMAAYYPQQSGPLSPHTPSGHYSGSYFQTSSFSSESEANRMSQSQNFPQPQLFLGSSDFVQTGDAVFSGLDEMPQPAFGSCSIQGMRSVNEDRLFCFPRLDPRISTITCFGVFDGHGGAQAADLCIDFIPKFLRSCIQSRGSSLTAGHMEAILSDCFCAADQEFTKVAASMGYTANDLTNLAYNMEHKTIASAGCTACLVFTIGKQIFCANAGDSRAVVYNSANNSIAELSHIHKPSDPTEQNRIMAAGGQVTMNGGCARVNNILATSRGIGDLYLKSIVIPNPDIRSQEIRQGDDFIIIASDGLWDVYSPAEACNIVLLAGDAQCAARALAEAAIQKGSEDNVSVIVVDIRTIFLYTPRATDDRPAVNNDPLPNYVPTSPTPPVVSTPNQRGPSTPKADKSCTCM